MVALYFGVALVFGNSREKQVRGTPPLSMVAYWAINRQGLQEATATDSNGRTANGGGCGGGGGSGEANGRLGASGKEEEEGREGSVSQQEMVFLSIVARYVLLFSLDHPPRFVSFVFLFVLDTSTNSYIQFHFFHAAFS